MADEPEGKGEIRPMTPAERADNARMWLEVASRERFVADVTGDGDPPIVVRLFRGEAVSLIRLLGLLRDNDVYADEANELISLLGPQISGQWETPTD